MWLSSRWVGRESNFVPAPQFHVEGKTKQEFISWYAATVFALVFHPFREFHGLLCWASWSKDCVPSLMVGIFTNLLIPGDVWTDFKVV